MPVIAIIGADPPAAAQARWFTRRGWSVCAAAAGDAAALPLADLYAVCLPEKAREAMLRVLLRRGGAAILLDGLSGIAADAAQRLATAARRRRCPLAITGSWRFVPAFARLREWSAGGVLGDIHHVEILLNDSAGATPDRVFAAADLACWLLGGTMPVPVAGRIAATDDGLRLVARATPAEIPSALGAASTASLRVAVGGTCGQAQATVQAAWSSAGLSVGEQTVMGTLHGRRRLLSPPPADPAAAELAVVAGCIERGQTWAGVCTVAQAAVALGQILSWSTPMPADPAPEPTPEG